MIVCNICGQAIAKVDMACPKCSGRGVERCNPLKGFLTPIQQRGSPDRWARSYTTPPSGPTTSAAKPTLGLSSQLPKPTKTDSPVRSHGLESTFDVALVQKPDSEELARVYGCILDPHVRHPSCTLCLEIIKPGAKLFLAPRALNNKCSRNDVLCRKCYASSFSLGHCIRCKLPVLGEREEGHGGVHVRAKFDSIWHSKCFVCHNCCKPIYGVDHQILPINIPCCMVCAEASLEPKIHTHTVPPARYRRPGELVDTTEKLVKSKRVELPETPRNLEALSRRTENKPVDLQAHFNYRTGSQDIRKDSSMAMQAKRATLQDLTRRVDNGGTNTRVLHVSQRRYFGDSSETDDMHSNVSTD